MKALMKAITLALRSAARAVGRLVWVVVQVGDRLISMLRPAPMPPVDQLEPEPADGAGQADGLMPIRELAYARMAGTMPSPATLAAAGVMASRWVSVMTPAMLAAVIAADNQRLHRHMRGIERIRGVVPFDRAAIDDVRMALERQPVVMTEELAPTPRRYA